ncbi:MAG: preprotein translocase subunit YajC [Planctomycetaceae bacterium]
MGLPTFTALRGLPREAPADPAPPPGGGGFWTSFGPILLLVAVFYLFLIRPANRKEKARREMLKALSKHDKVVTTGGMLGTVAMLDDETVTLEVARDVRLRFLRSAIHSIDRPPPDGKAEAADARKSGTKG